MKRLLPQLCLALSVLLLADLTCFARENRVSASGADAGRLVIRRRANLGYNISVFVSIDGRPAGTIIYGHTYAVHLQPGRHLISAVPGPGLSKHGPTHMLIDVRPGHTYSFVASLNNERILLRPAPLPRGM